MPQATDPMRSPVYRMADQMAGGQLADEMARLYADSHSWEDVSRVLFATYGVRVTGQTLRRWAAFLFETADTEVAS